MERTLNGMDFETECYFVFEFGSKNEKHVKKKREINIKRAEHKNCMKCINKNTSIQIHFTNLYEGRLESCSR